MPKSFHKIGLFAKHTSKTVADTLERLIQFLTNRDYAIVIETQSASLLAKNPYPTKDRETLGSDCDLVIVVGGDGSLLNAARAVVSYQVPVLGINRGRLGFLADILPDMLEEELTSILNGTYIKEQRFLLDGHIERKGKTIAKNIALNDIVLYCGSVARMVDFEVYIDDHFVLRQQADGLVTATPTGSTAYALSAGGPILYPTLNAMTIAPLCPHTLSSRPIVVESNSQIKLVIMHNHNLSPKLSFDGQLHFDLEPGDEIYIQKHPFLLTLIHPTHHEYYMVLREKLGWNIQTLKD